MASWEVSEDHARSDLSLDATLTEGTGNHFSMMKDPYAADLGKLIREGLDWQA